MVQILGPLSRQYMVPKRSLHTQLTDTFPYRTIVLTVRVLILLYTDEMPGNPADWCKRTAELALQAVAPQLRYRVHSRCTRSPVTALEGQLERAQYTVHRLAVPQCFVQQSPKTCDIVVRDFN